MDWSTDFSGKSAFVTGAGGGMGLAVATGLLNAGAEVTLFDLKDAPEGLPQGATYVQGDVSDNAAMSAAIEARAAASGRLDYLVNAAGVLWFERDKSAVDMDLDVWDQVMSINLKSVVHSVRSAVPLMKKSGGGAMVHISTIQCLRGDTAPQDAYQASKAGMVALSKSVAIQFAADQIRSNVVFPGPTLTPMQQRWYEDPSKGEAIADYVPLKRLGTPEDMANACLFLLSDAAGFVTGTELTVDGGITALP
ncbi:MAG: SDR family oxidoreductase [Rhodospirillaceae bacterium]|jgi:NAD(P)-dependent dehydrogenase (short-subunit alcohol dehydrogenase family)|nr:SDR family oxidoreductase [Rhodospirillaceae bacterium]MBT3627189.1 SDR family oxidoreductase [Rhodospirillaceae bacterium]MBT3925606.1 SDR family oxidoreductase [Rhodospirillaceae bacterium]MBT5674394.1 SDR family oxidoreductase [Rhodospirillaceae bacterium]MBT5778332.1 SDR family oxidoreductase [Rhodospirillaceae bacterium]